MYYATQNAHYTCSNVSILLLIDSSILKQNIGNLTVKFLVLNTRWKCSIDVINYCVFEIQYYDYYKFILFNTARKISENLISLLHHTVFSYIHPLYNYIFGFVVENKENFINHTYIIIRPFQRVFCFCFFFF